MIFIPAFASGLGHVSRSSDVASVITAHIACLLVQPPLLMICCQTHLGLSIKSQCFWGYFPLISRPVRASMATPYNEPMIKSILGEVFFALSIRYIKQTCTHTHTHIWFIQSMRLHSCLSSKRFLRREISRMLTRPNTASINFPLCFILSFFL